MLGLPDAMLEGQILQCIRNDLLNVVRQETMRTMRMNMMKQEIEQRNGQQRRHGDSIGQKDGYKMSRQSEQDEKEQKENELQRL